MRTDHQLICKPGEEKYKKFTRHNKSYVQYDFRAQNGELFSTVAPSLTACRCRRDAWLEKQP